MEYSYMRDEDGNTGHTQYPFSKTLPYESYLVYRNAPDFWFLGYICDEFFGGLSQYCERVMELYSSHDNSYTLSASPDFRLIYRK